MKRKDKIAVAVIAVFAVGVLVYLVAPGLFGSKRQTTNDAFVAADFTLVAPRVAGFIKEVLVEDNQRVKAGQLLALIDDRDFRAAAQAADADTLVAQAQLKNATATLERQSSVIAQAQDTELWRSRVAVAFFSWAWATSVSASAAWAAARKSRSSINANSWPALTRWLYSTSTSLIKPATRGATKVKSAATKASLVVWRLLPNRPGATR